MFGAAVVIDRDPSPLPGPDDPDLRPVAFTARHTGCHVAVAADGRTVIRHDGIGEFIVTNGDTVLVRPVPGVDPRRARAALHSSVPSAVLAQQGRFALHATTVALDGIGIAIAGGSGAGKSSTALGLVAAGAEPVVDDITVLDPDPPGPPTTCAFGRSARAFPDVLASLGFVDDARSVPGADGKVEIDWPSASTAAVHLVVVLRVAEIDRPEVGRPSPARIVRTLAAVTHLGALAERIDGHRLFAWHTSVAATTELVVVRRPSAGWPVDDLCRIIGDLARSVASR